MNCIECGCRLDWFLVSDETKGSFKKKTQGKEYSVNVSANLSCVVLNLLLLI